MNRTICCSCPGKQGCTKSTGELRREGRQKPAADLKTLCRNKGFSRDELQPLLETKALAEEIGLLWFWQEAAQIKLAWLDPLPPSRGDTELVRKWEPCGEASSTSSRSSRSGWTHQDLHSDAPGQAGDPLQSPPAGSLCHLWSAPLLFQPKPEAAAGRRGLRSFPAGF